MPLSSGRCCALRDPSNIHDAHGRHQALSLDGLLVNLLDDVHASNYTAERGEALAVGVSPATEVEFRLIADADEDF